MDLKDIKNRIVKVGDKVVVVCKEYGYRKITDAYMVIATYDGSTNRYHKFLNEVGIPFKVSYPQVYKI